MAKREKGRKRYEEIIRGARARESEKMREVE